MFLPEKKNGIIDLRFQRKDMGPKSAKMTFRYKEHRQNGTNRQENSLKKNSHEPFLKHLLKRKLETTKMIKKHHKDR